MPPSALSTPRKSNLKSSLRLSGNGSASSSRPKRVRNETPLDRRAAATMAKVKKIRRLQNAADRVSAAERAARASAAESATRTRLVLLRAWERLQAVMPGSAREGSGGVDAGTASNGGGVDAGSGGALGAGVLQQQHHPPAPGASAMPATERAALQRCLREACWLARSRLGTPPGRPGQGVEEPAAAVGCAGGAGAAGANGVNGGAGGGAEGVDGGGCLAGPLATPVMDLPRAADVQAALSLLTKEGDNQENGSRRDGDGSPRAPVAAKRASCTSSSPPSSSDEGCLLCGAPVLSPSDRAAVGAGAGGVGAKPGDDGDSPRAKAPPGGAGGEKSGSVDGGEVGGGGEGKKGGAVDAIGAAGKLELPGWAVCRRGHRLRRCMETLAPALGVSYRRCEVCRCVLVSPDSFPGPEVSEGGGGGAGGRHGVLDQARGSALWMRERSACVFCNVSLAPGSSAVNWLE